VRRPVLLPLLVTALTCTASCGAAPEPGAAASAPAGAVVTVGRAQVRAEVADTPDERARGLMGRTSVPPGTGMLFRYDAPSTGRYWMVDVPVPLTAVFARSGRVVSVVEMAPCTSGDSSACPTYGAAGPFDTVLETAPATLAGRVAPGDALTWAGQPS
jgi:uncharacterized protein